MTELSRRSLLAGTAALGAVLTATAPSRAAAPPAGKQAPGYYRYKVGDFELTQISDGSRTFPLPDGFVKNAPKDEVNKALEASFMPKDQMTIVFNPLVVNTGSKLVLIDSGLGPQGGATGGMLAANLAAAGIDAKTIDIVVISHFHGDHINGLVTKDNAAAFPNAEVKVPAAEHAFWMSDDNMGKAQGGILDNFKNVRRVMGVAGGKVTRYDPDKEVAPGITAVATPGHTPGHTSYVVASGNGKLIVQSDVTNHPALFVRNPNWHAVFDMDGAQAEQTRRKLYDMAVAEKLMIAGFHYPFPSIGNVEKDGTGYRLIPAGWNPSI